MQISADTLRSRLTWPKIVAALRDIFVTDVQSPVRHHHFIDVPNAPQATLLLMPAWIEGQYLGVKQVSVFPGNNAQGLPGLTSLYTLSCGKTGQTLAQMDGNVITAIRTAAASALASSYLSRPDSRAMLMLGAGRMGRHLVPAHCSVRPIEIVWIWNRNHVTASEFVAELQAQGIDARICKTEQLADIAGKVDIISCATLANEPIILGEWLKPGVHMDLVGSFTPMMREVDNLAMQKAEIFVDTRAGALAETGDLIIPIREGAIVAEDIQAELTELCSGKHLGRQALNQPDQAITLFKSVGDSREDLAAAMLAYQDS
ncbi:ornithine cyclodeaminase family protein [Marinomonas sp. M1K-6]|uniref:Ornithine cyclodeaminase family protein n=1 Tax=Marinomonas profundi TaxID=2726122 RepID=A0A847QWV6_9GAMM|nr:ornithine cyclodeaminase family protein [Marinomonas profundi]NLQ17968.1 ornithine cyclodeaminase family protein [Marinomonas profundi]UDV01694.1 ornithine cyclodeaminase family protein [Marinomonas profundi]